MSVSFGGLSSGLNTDQIISQLLRIERQPQIRYENQIEQTEEKQQAFQDLNSRIESLIGNLDTLSQESTFKQKSISNSNPNALSASITDQEKVQPGTFDVYVEQLATNAETTSGKQINDQKMVDLDQNNATLVSDFEQVEGAGNLDLTGTSSTEEMLAQFSKEIQTSGDGAPEFSINGEDFDLDSFNTVQGLIDEVNNRLTDVKFGYDQQNDKFFMAPTDSTVSNPGGTAITTDDIQSNIIDGSKGFLQQIGFNENETAHTFADQQSDLGRNLLSVDAEAQLQNNLFTSALSTDGGEVEVRVNNTNITLQETDTINDFVSQVNDNVEGVSATFNSATDKVNLRTEDVGGGSIAVEDVRGNLADVLNLRTDGSETGGQAGGVQSGGTDAEVQIDGDTVTADGNQVSFNGIQLDLKELYQESENSNPVKLEVGKDSEGIANDVQNFVQQFNSIMEFINTRSNSNPASQPGEQSGESGVFANDSTVRRIKNTLIQTVTSRFKNATGSDVIQDAGSVGIEQRDPITAPPADQGKLNFDSGKFQDALNDAPTAVEDLFTASTDDGDAADGIGTELLDYTQNGVTDELDGILPARIDGFDRTIQNLNERIQENQEDVQARRDQLEQKFLAMEQTLSRLNSQQSFLSARL
jgi:flagellar hook-associated protein 2